MPTINGKPINQIMQELLAPFPQDEIQTRSDNGQIYFDVETFRNRFDSVCGREHYNEFYPIVGIHEAKDTIGISATCRIELLDDNFNVILSKEAGGGSHVIFPKDDQKNELTKTTSFGNNVTAACQDAFKKVCRRFGMGVEQIKTKQQGEIYLVQLLYPVDYSRANKGYFTKVNVCTQNSQPQQVQLAVFGNKLSTFKAQIPQGTAVGSQFYIRGNMKENGQYGSQVVFSDFYK